MNKTGLLPWWEADIRGKSSTSGGERRDSESLQRLRTDYWGQIDR